MNFLDKLAPHAHWLMRLALGGAFMWHGITKFTGGIENTATMLGLPLFIAVLVASAETSGGAFILIGGAIKKDIVTRVGGLFIAIIMVGALVLVKFKMGWPQMEIDVAFLAMSLFFLLTGNKSGAMKK